MPWLAFLPLLAMVAVSPSSSAAATSPFTDEFAVFIQQTLEQQKLPGVALGVVDGDDVFTQVGPPLTGLHLRSQHSNTID